MLTQRMYGYPVGGAYTGGNLSRNIPTVKGGVDGFKQTLQSAALRCSESMDSIFDEASRQYGVPSNLLKAVAKAESDFNPNATSPKGAAGVMQLMPATAKSLGVANPYDARSNIMGGAKYLKDMLNRHGSVELALAAYNAGSGNVKKYGGIPPFKETQNYVKKIMGYLGQELSADRMVMTGGSLDGADRYAYKMTIGGKDYYISRIEGADNSDLLSGDAADNSLHGMTSQGGVMDEKSCQYLVELLRFRMQTALSGVSTFSSDDMGFI